VIKLIVEQALDEGVRIHKVTFLQRTPSRRLAVIRSLGCNAYEQKENQAVEMDTHNNSSSNRATRNTCPSDTDRCPRGRNPVSVPVRTPSRTSLITRLAEPTGINSDGGAACDA
jgi:hypothetical protein